MNYQINIYDIIIRPLCIILMLLLGICSLEPLSAQVSPSPLGEIPGIFTPNGDDINDKWEIPGIDQYPDASIKIYNRAKKLMIELKGVQMPWDGHDYSGKILESGYYLYVIELRKGGERISGFVTILR